jgi:hypothetical protein
MLGQQEQRPHGHIVLVVVAAAAAQARHLLLACLAVATRGRQLGATGAASPWVLIVNAVTVRVADTTCTCNLHILHRRAPQEDMPRVLQNSE